MNRVRVRDRLGRRFFRRDAVTVARALLGHLLVHRDEDETTVGVIVETEAYLGTADRAAHSYGGRRTARTETMFADGGTAYIYLNYGIHRLLNFVVATVDDPQAVLIRAVEPKQGVEAMYRRRPKARAATDLCSGPGKVGAAFGIRLDQDGTDMVTSDHLFVQRNRRYAVEEHQIVASPRVGIGYAGEWVEKPLRFSVANNPHVSVTPR